MVPKLFVFSKTFSPPALYEGGSESSVIGARTLLIDMIG